MIDYRKVYEEWLNNDFFDENTKKDLVSIKDDEEEIKDRFYKVLEFGTAGLRGKLGAGTNRMNKYMVSKAAQALANTIIDHGKEAIERGVALSYDVRYGSKEFAELTCSIMAGNGIKSYIYKEIRPTPMCSYAIRKLNCIAGVMVTASHNPQAYNGYKAYQTAEWMRVDYWEFVRELLSFDNRFRTYLMIRMTIFPISVVFVSFLYLNKKHNLIKYNIGRNNKYEKELWKDRLKFAIVPVLHYVIVLTIMVVLALSTGNNIDYKFFWEIKEGSFLYGIKDNQLLLFGFEQVITMFGTYILSVMGILCLESLGKLRGTILFFVLMWIAHIIVRDLILYTILGVRLNILSYMPGYYLVYSNYGEIENKIFNPLPSMICLILLFYYINKKKLDID